MSTAAREPVTGSQGGSSVPQSKATVFVHLAVARASASVCAGVSVAVSTPVRRRTSVYDDPRCSPLEPRANNLHQNAVKGCFVPPGDDVLRKSDRPISPLVLTILRSSLASTRTRNVRAGKLGREQGCPLARILFRLFERAWLGCVQLVCVCVHTRIRGNSRLAHCGAVPFPRATPQATLPGRCNTRTPASHAVSPPILAPRRNLVQQRTIPLRLRSDKARV